MAAVTIAFILEPFVALLMRIRFPRSLASFVVCTIALPLLYVIGLGAYSQLPRRSTRTCPSTESASATSWTMSGSRIEGMENRTYQLLVPARQRQQDRSRNACGSSSAGRTGAQAQQRRAPPPRRRRRRFRTRFPKSGFTRRATPIGDYIWRA